VQGFKLGDGMIEQLEIPGLVLTWAKPHPFNHKEMIGGSAVVA
jgi:hypothetical protein